MPTVKDYKVVNNQLNSFYIGPNAYNVDVENNLIDTLNCTDVSKNYYFSVSYLYHFNYILDK